MQATAPTPRALISQTEAAEVCFIGAPSGYVSVR
jgi:hypothetical protein